MSLGDEIKAYEAAQAHQPRAMPDDFAPVFEDRGDHTACLEYNGTPVNLGFRRGSDQDNARYTEFLKRSVWQFLEIKRLEQDPSFCQTTVDQHGVR